IGSGNRNNIGARPSNPIAGGGNRGGLGGGNRASTLPAGGGGNRWQHNPEHRGGAPYRDRATAQRFGGTTRGDSLPNRQANARQQIGRQGSNFGSNPATGRGDRAAGDNLGGRSGGDGIGNRGAGSSADRIGSRDLSRSGGGNRDAFGGGSRGYNGSSA